MRKEPEKTPVPKVIIATDKAKEQERITRAREEISTRHEQVHVAHEQVINVTMFSSLWHSGS